MIQFEKWQTGPKLIHESTYLSTYWTTCLQVVNHPVSELWGKAADMTV